MQDPLQEIRCGAHLRQVFLTCNWSLSREFSFFVRSGAFGPRIVIGAPRYIMELKLATFFRAILVVRYRVVKPMVAGIWQVYYPSGMGVLILVVDLTNTTTTRE